MSFYGCSFSYNGINSSQLNLMVYDFSDEKNDDSPAFSSTPDVIEDRLPNKCRAYYYGSKQNEPLKIKLVFGINQDLLDANKHIDRYDIDMISSWLSSTDGYKWLTIDQPDMQNVRYNCVLESMNLIEYGSYPYGFSCVFKCDSSFAYSFPEKFIFTSTSSDYTTHHIFNKSSFNGYYYPRITIDAKENSSGSYTDISSVSIINVSDKNRETSIGNSQTHIPNSVRRIDIDNENCIISNNQELNIYDLFNFKFFRMKRGDNIIKVKGDFILSIECEFPVNFGG